MRPTAQARITAALVVLAAAGAARAQAPEPDPEGPIIVGEQTERFRLFELDRFGGSVDLFARRQVDERRTPGAPKIRDTEDLFRETLSLSGRAFIGHRNLIDLNVSVQLGLEDSFLDSDTFARKEHDNTFRNLYDISALILGEGPAPLTVYTRRDQTLLDREFAASIDSTTTETGAFLLVKSDVAPTTFRYFHREQEQIDRLGMLDFGLVQDTFEVESEIRLADKQRLSLDYTYDLIDEDLSFGATQQFDRHNALAVHTIDFGPEDRYNLRSSLRYFEQNGDINHRQVRWDETLLLRHTDRFETRYDLSVDDQTIEGQNQRMGLGAFSLRHRLFESLVTTARLGGSATTIEDEFETTNVFGDVGLQYTKAVPYGRLDASVGLGFNREDNGERGSELAILNDSRVFSDPQPIVISRRNVVPGSIVVTDAANVRVFVQGVDYTVRVLPDRVEIRRLVGGAIADGQQVLVDYRVGPEPASTVDTVVGNFAVRYSITEGRLSGLDVYLTYQQVDQMLRKGSPLTIVLDDTQRLVYGVEYRIWAFTFTGEQEHFDSSVTPFDALRLGARFDQRIGPSSALTVDLTREELDFPRDDNRVELNRITATWFQQLSSELDFRAHLLYRDERDRFSGNTRGFEQALEVHWTRAQTDVFASVRNAMLEGDNADTMFQTFTLNIRRSF